MSKARLIVPFVAISAVAQGTIVFDNLNIPITGGGAIGGGNGNGTYNASIWRSRDSRLGAGGGVVAGLFVNGSDVPIAMTLFGDGEKSHAFLHPQFVIVPGVAPGERTDLTVMIWEHGAGRRGSFVRFSVTFQSNELGGTRLDGTIVPPPKLTGFGPQNGEGFELLPWFWLWPPPFPNPPPCRTFELFTYRSGTTLQISWPGCDGKKYQLLTRSLDGPWANYGEVITGDVYHVGRNVEITDVSAASLFRCVEVD